MLETFLTHEMIVRGEPALDDYLRSDQLNFDMLKDEAFSDLMKDLIDQGLDIKNLSKQYSLQTSVTKTAAFTGTITTDEDFAQRMRIVIDVTALTGNATFTLQGTDDDGTNYYDIPLLDLVSSDKIKTIYEKGTYTFSLMKLYKKYRLNLITIGTTITYSAYLVEDIYTTLHRDLTRSKIYGNLFANEGDVWQRKYEYYKIKYEESLTKTKFFIDEDESGDISEDESDKSVNQNIIFN